MSESSKRSRAACGKASIPRDPGRAGEGAARSALRSVPSPCSLRLSMSGVGARRRGDAAAAASSSATMRSPERPSCPPGRRCRGPSIGNWAGVSRPAHNGRNLASRAHQRKGDDVSVLIKSDSNSPYIEGFSPYRTRLVTISAHMFYFKLILLRPVVPSPPQCFSLPSLSSLPTSSSFLFFFFLSFLSGSAHALERTVTPWVSIFI